MPEGMDLGWTSFPDHLPESRRPERNDLADLRPCLREALKDHIFGWTNTEHVINDILDQLVGKVSLEREGYVNVPIPISSFLAFGENEFRALVISHLRKKTS